MNKIRKILKNPLLSIAKLIEKTACWYSDELYLRLQYLFRLHKKLDLKNPKSFNEKLQWLKLYNRISAYTTMVDKYTAKEYVANIIGTKYLIPTLGIWDNPDDIDWDSLPNQFVLKCTHDSGGIILCRDKSCFNIEKAKEELCRCLKTSYFPVTREWPYLNVKPRVIAEKYMSNNKNELIDYKVHCFNGTPKVILVCQNRFGTGGLMEDFYSDKWEHLDVKRPNHPNANEFMEKPDELDELLQLSQQLSVNIPFVRTDFYIIDGQIYFGEITFYPSSGLAKFEPEEWDYKFGEWMKLPKQNYL